MRRLVSILLTLMLTSRVLAADPPISLIVYPRFQHAPGTVRISLVIQRDQCNRLACVSIEGDTGYTRTSCWDHVGEGARYQTVITYSDLPAGHYAAVADLAQETVREGRTTVRTPVVEFRVLGVGESDEP